MVTSAMSTYLPYRGRSIVPYGRPDSSGAPAVPSVHDRWCTYFGGTSLYSGRSSTRWGAQEGWPLPAETHVNSSPMDRSEILDLVRDRLAEILEIEPSSINEGDSFSDDLEADSLALIELVEAIEEELSERTVGFRIDDEDLEDLRTVRDAVDYIDTKANS